MIFKDLSEHCDWFFKDTHWLTHRCTFCVCDLQKNIFKSNNVQLDDLETKGRVGSLGRTNSGLILQI